MCVCVCELLYETFQTYANITFPFYISPIDTDTVDVVQSEGDKTVITGH